MRPATPAGNGCAPGTSPEVCPDCHGTGTVQVRRQTPMGVFATSPLPQCGGRADYPPALQGLPGQWYGAQEKTIQASIPAGIDNWADHPSVTGHAGKNGGGPAGDLLITITVRPHELFGGAPPSCARRLSPSPRRVLGAELEIPPSTAK